MLDLDKVKLGEDGKLDGLEDQLTELTRATVGCFRLAHPIPGCPPCPPAVSMARGGTAGGDGVEAAFNKLNPWHKSET